MRKRISLLLTAMMLALPLSFGGAGAAFAKITPAQPPSCENGGGQHRTDSSRRVRVAVWSRMKPLQPRTRQGMNLGDITSKVDLTREEGAGAFTPRPSFLPFFTLLPGALL
jgi:hypothetical protein